MDGGPSSAEMGPSPSPDACDSPTLNTTWRAGGYHRWKKNLKRTGLLLALTALVVSLLVSRTTLRSRGTAHTVLQLDHITGEEEGDSLAWEGRHLEGVFGGGRKQRRRRSAVPLESLRVTVMGNSTLLGKRFGNSEVPLVLPDQPGSVGMWNALMRPKPRYRAPQQPAKPVVKKPKACEPNCPRSYGIITVKDDNPGKECPKTFSRLSYRDIRAKTEKPYLLGGHQKPSCTNCKRESEQETWALFCSFQSSGPVCRPDSQAELLDMWLGRADRGAPGVKDMLTSTPCDLWQYIQGRTLWVVGDSLAQETMKALMCFFTEFWDHDEYIDRPWGDASKQASQALPSINNNGWCIYLPRQTRICHIRSQNVPDLVNQVLPGFKSGKFKKDLFLFNFAVHYNDPEKFKERLNNFADYYTQNSEDLPFFIWRDGSPQHFKTPHGVVTGARPRVPPGCQPLQNVGLNDMNELVLLNGDDSELETLQGGWRNKLSTPIMQELGIPNLHIWNESVLLNSFYYNYHPPDAKFVDCTHACHPSFYQLWVYKLTAKLREIQSSLPKLTG